MPTYYAKVVLKTGEVVTIKLDATTPAQALTKAAQVKLDRKLPDMFPPQEVIEITGLRE